MQQQYVGTHPPPPLSSSSSSINRNPIIAIESYHPIPTQTKDKYLFFSFKTGRKRKQSMWNHLSLDLLAKIFSFLQPDSLACAASTCRDWRTCTKSHPPIPSSQLTHPWFLSLTSPKHHHHHASSCCYAYNPVLPRWYLLSLDFLPHQPIHPIASIGGLILYRSPVSTSLQLALCNPFTKHYKLLPPLHTQRTTPAIGVEVGSSSSQTLGFRVFIAGGMSTAPSGASWYDHTLQMYDSKVGHWESLGSMPIEFAVRLTVWTPNESVYSMGVLYWITSARAYSIMGLDVKTSMWKEVHVPMADTLEFAALIRRRGKLTLIGGNSCGEGCIWELGSGDVWLLIERVPIELGKKFMASRGNWCNTKCVGSDGAVYLYRDLGAGMLAWVEVGEGNGGRWDWFWVEGCCQSIKGRYFPNFPTRGLLLHPAVAPSLFLD